MAEKSDDNGHNENHIAQLVRVVVDHGIDGVPPLKSAADLAEEYKRDKKYKTDDERVAALIRWESTKNFSSGLVTGIGGWTTLPISIPSALGASWVLQARLAGAIAYIYGHDLHEDRVRTLALLSILGDSAKEVLKRTGVIVGNKVTRAALMKIPGKVLVEINKKVGFRLLTKAGEKGAVNLLKVVPVVGGVVSGLFDAATCVAVGKVAKELFGPEHPVDIKDTVRVAKAASKSRRKPSQERSGTAHAARQSPARESANEASPQSRSSKKTVTTAQRKTKTTTKKVAPLNCASKHTANKAAASTGTGKMSAAGKTTTKNATIGKSRTTKKQSVHNAGKRKRRIKATSKRSNKRG